MSAVPPPQRPDPGRAVNIDGAPVDGFDEQASLARALLAGLVVLLIFAIPIFISVLVDRSGW